MIFLKILLGVAIITIIIFNIVKGFTPTNKKEFSQVVTTQK